MYRVFQKKIITYELEMFSLPTVCHFEFEDKYKVNIKKNEGVNFCYVFDIFVFFSIQTVSINWLQKSPIRQGFTEKKEFSTKGGGEVSDGWFL